MKFVYDLLANPLAALFMFVASVIVSLLIARKQKPSTKIHFDLYHSSTAGENIIMKSNYSNNISIFNNEISVAHLAIWNDGNQIVDDSVFTRELKLIGNVYRRGGMFYSCECVMIDNESRNCITCISDPENINIKLHYLRPNECIWIKIVHDYLDCCVDLSGYTKIEGMITPAIPVMQLFRFFLPFSIGLSIAITGKIVILYVWHSLILEHRAIAVAGSGVVFIQTAFLIMQSSIISNNIFKLYLLKIKSAVRRRFLLHMYNAKAIE